VFPSYFCGLIDVNTSFGVISSSLLWFSIIYFFLELSERLRPVLGLFYNDTFSISAYSKWSDIVLLYSLIIFVMYFYAFSNFELWVFYFRCVWMLFIWLLLIFIIFFFNETQLLREFVTCVLDIKTSVELKASIVLVW